jgi:RepB DNA-primase from phage plasmid
MQQDEAEALRTLAQKYGGDPATTDSTRVFRLPGFNNKKYEDDFTVTVRREAPPDRVYRRADFKIDITLPEKVSASPRSSPSHRSQGERNRSQSERDWSFALRHLKEGAKPEDIVTQIAAYRSLDHRNGRNTQHPEAARKTNPMHYAERTVQRAMAHLGMSPAPQESQVPDGSSSPEVKPSR